MAKRIPMLHTVEESPVVGPAPQSSPRSHLLNLLDEVAKSVRAGQYATSDRDGVLVDTIVGGTRCLLLVHDPSPLVCLSPREREIARMVAEGRTNQAIAGALGISIWTVSTHLRRIFAKLAVCSRAEMVARLLERPEVTRLLSTGEGDREARGAL
jgi:DNA-binding CsgD family transcriptional regulator